MQRLLRGLSHAKILQDVLGGKIASRTGDVFRGKGLPGINSATSEGRINNLVIISNRAYANVSGGEFRMISTPFRGTFVYWEVVREKDK